MGSGSDMTGRKVGPPLSSTDRTGERRSSSFLHRGEQWGHMQVGCARFDMPV